MNPVYEAAFNALPADPITRGREAVSHPRRGITTFVYHAARGHRQGRWTSQRESRCALQDRPAHFVAWAGERQDGGRSVGFGGHYHANVGDENFREIVPNALLWIAKAEVPPNGVQVTVTPAELTENLDPKQPSVRPQGAPPASERGALRIEFLQTGR